MPGDAEEAAYSAESAGSGLGWPLGLTFHHVGIACKRIADERATFEALGFVQEGPTFSDPDQRVRAVFMLSGGYRVELLEPIGELADSPLASYLKRGVRLYHHGFEVRGLEEAIRTLVDGGALLLVHPTPAVAFAGRRIAFVAMRTGLIMELIEI